MSHDPEIVYISPGPGQPEEPGVEIDIEEATERLNEVKLADGTEIKLRLNLVRVIRFLEKIDDKGNPVFNMEGNVQVAIKIPDNQSETRGQHD